MKCHQKAMTRDFPMISFSFFLFKFAYNFSIFLFFAYLVSPYCLFQLLDTFHESVPFVKTCESQAFIWNFNCPLIAFLCFSKSLSLYYFFHAISLSILSSLNFSHYFFFSDLSPPFPLIIPHYFSVSLQISIFFQETHLH